LGSCTANAVGAAYQIEMIKKKAKDFIPSRLFIYYNERVIDNDVSQDNGSSLRTGIKTLNKQGVCPEIMWAYREDKFIIKPPKQCYTEGLKNQVLSYERIDGTKLELIKSAISSKSPVVFGFAVYDYFESKQMSDTGVLRMPRKGEAMVGGHAVVAVGYDNSKNAVLVRNSWSSDWGIGGYFWMPYSYITNANLADDFWRILIIES
jgi:C1A family cysteine protease